MKKITINNKEYEVVEDERDSIDEELLNEKVTDYFDEFDYIFGDYSYDKLRLKGYYASNNKKASKINDIKTLKEYKEKYCNFGARTFLLKKIK